MRETVTELVTKLAPPIQCQRDRLPVEGRGENGLGKRDLFVSDVTVSRTGDGRERGGRCGLIHGDGERGGSRGIAGWRDVGDEELVVVPTARLRSSENLVPTIVASPRSMFVVPSKTSTVWPVAASDPLRITTPVSVRPGVTPVLGVIARLVGEAGVDVSIHPEGRERGWSPRCRRCRGWSGD